MNYIYLLINITATYILLCSSKSESTDLQPSALLGLWANDGPLPDSQSMSASVPYDSNTNNTQTTRRKQSMEMQKFHA